MVRLILLLLFVGLPLLEFALLVRVYKALGLGNTIALVIVTGVVGSALARRQGLSVLRQMEARLAAGQVPGSQLGHGALIFAAGLLLITPGILTDVLGILLLVPVVRTFVAARAFHFLARRFKGRIVFTPPVGPGDMGNPPTESARQVDARIIDPPATNAHRSAQNGDETPGM